MKDHMRNAPERQMAGRRSAILAALALLAILAVVEVLALGLVAG